MQEKINEKQKRLMSWNEIKKELSIKWIQNESTERSRKLSQGHVYTCEIGENIGSEIRGHGDNEESIEEIKHVRPVLIISDNRYNRNGLVTVLPLTSTVRVSVNEEGRKSPKIKNNYILRKSKYNYLKNDSTVSTGQIKTVSSVRLIDFIGYIDDTDLAGVKNRLKSYFNI